MTRLTLLSEQAQPTFQHASMEEYAAFVHRYADQDFYRRDLLRFSRRFVQRYPDLHEWFAAPLTERIGRLYGEDHHHVFCPASYRARVYLLFLALQGYAPLDWEWLIAVREINLERLLWQKEFSSNFPSLLERAVAIGYKPEFARDVLQWGAHRLFLHLGTTQIEDIHAAHLAEFREALERFRHRPDVACFFGSVEYYTRQLTLHYLRDFHVLHNVLYHCHQGNIEAPRRRGRRPPPRTVLRPRMEAIITRYIAERQLTDQPRTGKQHGETLHAFMDWLIQTHPELETFAEVTRDHLMEYAEALSSMRNARTNQPLAAGTKHQLLSKLSVFFNQVACWEWDDVPTRPLLQQGDLPKIPQRLPRYIPDDELDRLMTAIRALECPYQRAALLIARWCGARREEIQRLSVDCLDSYPDGTPRLRIPAGKTRQERMVPLNQEAADAIRVLQALWSPQRGLPDRHTRTETCYLFMHYGKLFCVEYLFKDALEKACSAAGLVTSDGKPTITAHRFRHTVGTQLARRGARFRTIQKILGHQSAAMSMVYIDLTDEDVRQDYQTVLGSDAVIAGPGAQLVRSGELAESEIRWIQENFFKTELELGRCLRLPQEGPCECALYLTCAKFVTSPEYAPRLRRRRRIEQELVEDARQHGWQREIERHQCTIKRLEQLLADLGESIDGPAATE